MKFKTSWFALIKDVILCCVIVGFITFWKTLIVILTTKLEINENVVSGKIGLLRIQTLDSPVNKITSVKVDQSLLGRILNYGNVYINTPAGNFEFECMAKPNEIKKYLLSLMQ